MDGGLRHAGFDVVFRAIAAARADRWGRGLGQGLGVILTLHHVRPWQPRGYAPNRLLEIEPGFLDRVLAFIRGEGWEIISLSEMAARLRGETSGPFAVALTFDDGYRDNLEHARPILLRHGAPWTLFVTTGFADGAEPLWWLDLEEAVGRLSTLALTIGGERLSFEFGGDAPRMRAFRLLYRKLRARPEPEMRATIAALAAHAGVDPLARTRELCLGWDELRALAADPAVEIGAHTLSHPMLARRDLATAQREITESKLRLEFELARPVRHLAYPVGDRSSAGPREFDLAGQAGFETGVTTRPGHLFAGHAAHLTALPRVSLNGYHQNEAAMRALLSGLPFLALNRGRRLDVA